MDGRRLPDLGRRGEGWFIVQIVIFVAIALAGTLGPAWSGAARSVSAALGLLLGGAGGLLAFRGLIDLNENLTPFPKPLSGGRLIDSGSYGLVRHPIYGGLVMGAAGWGLVTASLPALAATLLLLAFFDLKSRREEVWLAEAYEDYPAYRRRTRKIIPWVY